MKQIASHHKITLFLLPILFLFICSTGLSADLMELDNMKPAGFAETTNPYGYKVGDPFPLVIKNEVVFYGNHIGTGNFGLKDTNSKTDLDNLIRNPITNTGSSDYSDPGGTYCYVQAIALDADGDGRKNHVVFVGLDSSNYHAVAWVVNMDDSNRKAGAVCDIGPMTWIDDGNYKQYNSSSLFAITAGDYDGNGKDSVVIAVPLDYGSTGYYGSRLYEFTVDTTYQTLTNQGYSTKHLPYDPYKDITDDSNSSNTCRNKLAISLASGDFNGDFTDDLAVLSYHHVLTQTNVNKSFYDPNLVIVYKTELGHNVIDASQYERYYLMTVSGTSATFPMACSLTTGNWDNDDCEDLAVVGVIGSATLNGSNISGQISVSDVNWYIQRIFGDSGENFIVESHHKVDTNEWFEDGFYTSDNCYGRVMAEGFAINGETNPDMLFISGSLYDISGNAPVYKGQNGYFNSGDEGLTSHTASNTFIQSTAVGNFIGDPAGREQVLYTVGMKRNNHDQYYYKCGYVAGKDYADTDSTYGIAQGYHFSSVDDDSSYIFEATEDSLSYGLNCSFIAADYDNDSVFAKYIGKQYAYSDPTVSMVLQTAPYFSEVSGPGSSWTEYILTTIYSNSDTGSKTLGASIGISGGGGIPGIVNVSATLQYACSLTESWEETMTTTTSQSFVATTYDTVVVNRIPVFIYQYDVLDENGNWQNGAAMELMTPRPAVYESLSVDAYNEFAKAYNDQMNSKGSEFYRLETIDKAANYLDNNEGNPYAYNQHGWGDVSVNATQISNTPISLGTNNALGRVSWTVENTHTDSWENTNSFHFDFTARFGPESFGAGPSGSIDYSKGHGEATTTGSAVGAACSVQDIDGPGLSAAGVPLNVIESFGFDWTFGRWERHLSGESSNKTPFIGYALSNVTSAPLSVKDLKAAALDSSSIQLTWTKPTAHGNWPDIIGYDVYALNSINGEYTKVGQRLDADAVSYTVTGLSPLTQYTFVIVSVARVGGNDANSIWSNEASAQTTSVTYTLTYAADDEKAADITVKTVNGDIVNSGDKVEAGTILKITATAKDDHCEIIDITIKSGVDVTTVKANNEGTSATAFFVMNNNTDVTVTTHRTLTSADVTYKDSYDGGTVSAEVYGIVLAAPGGTVSAPVTFTATPAEGYLLEAWKITCDGVTYVKDAANMNPFDLPLEYETNYVEAIFTPSSEAKVTVTVVQPDEGGTIELTDTEGKSISLNEANSVTLSYGQEITVTAKPTTGYVFTAWTEDASTYTTESFTTKVEDNMTIGVNFIAPVKYSLKYNVDGDEGCGFIATTPTSQSGDLFAAGTEVTIKITAAEGYYISGATLSQGTDASSYEFTAIDDKIAIETTITMKANTTLDVKFSPCPCEKFNDINRTSWYHRSVIGAVENCWMEGYSNTIFAPMDNATRAQIVTILYRMAGSPEVNFATNFTDIPADAWYTKAVVWAEANGIAKGMTPALFAPDREVSREQMVTFFHRYALFKGLNSAHDADLSRFSDYGEISSYALESMKWAVHNHLIIGMGDGKLKPCESSTRAQLATILTRLDKLH